MHKNNVLTVVNVAKLKKQTATLVATHTLSTPYEER